MWLCLTDFNWILIYRKVYLLKRREGYLVKTYWISLVSVWPMYTLVHTLIYVQGICDIEIFVSSLQENCFDVWLVIVIQGDHIGDLVKRRGNYFKLLRLYLFTAMWAISAWLCGWVASLGDFFKHYYKMSITFYLHIK